MLPKGPADSLAPRCSERRSPHRRYCFPACSPPPPVQRIAARRVSSPRHPEAGQKIAAYRSGAAGRRTWAALRQRDDLPRPQRRNHPLHHVSRRVAPAHDVPVTIHFVSLGSDHFAGNGDIRSGEADAVELQLQIALTDEVSGLLVRLQVSSEVASPRKNILSEFPEAAQVADHRVTNIGSS